MKNTTHTLVAIVGIAGIVGIAQAEATPLTGSGPHLFINDATPEMPELEGMAYGSIIYDTSFDAGWSNSVLPAWRGTFSATGATMGGPDRSPGTTIMDFSELPTGELSVGTFFQFGDLDRGSGNEVFTLQAFDDVGGRITEAWLSEIIGVRYVNGNPPPMNDMPSWSFQAGVYTFAGNHTGANPTNLFALESLYSISTLEFNRNRLGASLNLGAPVPTPGSASLLAIGGVLAARRRR